MNIYIVCAWYEVGMRHYSFTILKNLSKYPSSHYKIYVTLVLRNNVDDYPELKELSNLNIDYVILKNNYINILSKVFPYFFDTYVNYKVKKYDASLLYILFEGVFFKNIKSIQRNCKVLYTIHDLIPHEKNKTNWKEKWLSNVENKRAKYLLETADYILTNFHDQYLQLKSIYNKNIFYTSMPTLVNNYIANGDVKPPELNDNNYILFFGRIDKYKGLDQLIDCHLKSGVKNKLVIAGGGNFWFDIPETDRLVVINRYIDDKEFKYLFKNACCCVLPYISVTQTSLVSIPFYFKCPVILSAITNFLPLAHNSGALTCDFKNALEYSSCVESLNNKNTVNAIVESQSKYYLENYNAEAFVNKMEEIFDDIVNEV